MKISNNGVEFIKSYEGFCAKAYKCVSTEKYYTIGYGHYGADVKKDATITKAEALKLLKSDIAKFEKSVNSLDITLKQNSYDALVSFAYNCGSGNLTKLCKGRTLKEIAEHITSYNKSGGKVLAGLTKRRKAEQELILKDLEKLSDKYFPMYKGNSSSLVDALKSLNVNHTYTYRKKIALKNLGKYNGLGSENTTMLILLKKGKLIKP